MWKWLHQLARPERLYHVCGRFIPWLGLAAAACLLLGWAWGFGFAPKDYQQGDSFRIICLNGYRSLYWSGVADENVRYRGGGDGADRRGVHLYRAGDRFRLG